METAPSPWQQAVERTLEQAFYHRVTERSEQTGTTTYHLLPYYRTNGFGAIGVAAVITVTRDGQGGDWRASIGSGPQGYDLLAAFVEGSGARLSPTSIMERALLQALFPHLPLTRYAR